MREVGREFHAIITVQWRRSRRGFTSRRWKSTITIGSGGDTEGRVRGHAGACRCVGGGGGVCGGENRQRQCVVLHLRTERAVSGYVVDGVHRCVICSGGCCTAPRPGMCARGAANCGATSPSFRRWSIGRWWGSRARCAGSRSTRARRGTRTVRPGKSGKRSKGRAGTGFDRQGRCGRYGTRSGVET